MLQRNDAVPSFSLARARHIVADLFTPKPWIYWTDFLISAAIGNAGFSVAVLSLRDWENFLPGLPLVARVLIAFVAYLACSLAFYRISLFIHELVHIRTGTMLTFRAAWNLICGIPFLMPSFVYYTHIDHHRRRHYGTEQDGEYVAFGHESHGAIWRHLALSFVIPILAVLRFGVVGPISWFVPPLRRWVIQHASSMVIDYSYKRPLPETSREGWLIFTQEFFAFLWVMTLAVIPPVFLGRWPIPFITVGYCVSVFILTLNAIRTLASHRWSNDGHDEMSFTDQLLDSINVDRRPLLAELWGPIGTRFHALHHLFPGLPYHAMPTAHRRLMKELPEGSPYHQTEEDSLTSALLDLWKRSARATARSRIAVRIAKRKAEAAASAA